jgi:general secretion pathway protein A
MYLEYFGLKEDPYIIDNLDPRYFYLTPGHADSVAKCEYAIRSKSGLAVIYGDVGTGKTTILTDLISRFSGGEYTIAVFSEPEKTPTETALLKAVSEEFGLKPPHSKRAAFDQLQEFLAREVAEGRKPLLFIDEAHKFDARMRSDRDAFGLIRALTNLTAGNRRLIQIILFGQLELVPMLESRRELKSRVAQFGFLSPLTKEDALAVLTHRWQIAGGELPLPLKDEGLDIIYEAAKGLPRDLIKAMNTALMYAMGKKLQAVNEESAFYAVRAQRLYKDESQNP